MCNQIYITWYKVEKNFFDMHVLSGMLCPNSLRMKWTLNADISKNPLHSISKVHFILRELGQIYISIGENVQSVRFTYSNSCYKTDTEKFGVQPN